MAKNNPVRDRSLEEKGVLFGKSQQINACKETGLRIAGVEHFAIPFGGGWGMGDWSQAAVRTRGPGQSGSY